MLSCCFEAFSGISLKIHFLVNKVTISERSSEIIRKFVFLNNFEKEQILRKIRICCKQHFLFKAVKLDKYKQNYFSTQNEPHTAKLCFSVVLKHFCVNSLKISLFCQKSNSQKGALKY